MIVFVLFYNIKNAFRHRNYSENRTEKRLVRELTDNMWISKVGA